MKTLRWVTQPGDGLTVAEVLVRAEVDASAVADGRVFVGLRRVQREDETIEPGDVVEVAPPRTDAKAVGEFRVLGRAGDLIAVDKPAGMPTIADHAGAAHALVARVARSLGLDPARVHATSRLDREVSGVVILALDPAAAARLLRARERGDYIRRYVAVGVGSPLASQGTWDTPIGRARDPRLRAPNGRDATNARTHYAVCARAPRGEAMFAVAPVTGRTHQIRVHAAHAKAPLLGDKAYGGPTRLILPGGRVLEPRRIALHAARVTVREGSAEPFVFTSPVPADLLELWSALGGEPAAWDLAASCEHLSS